MRGFSRCGLARLFSLAASIALISADFVIKDGQLAIADASGISSENVEFSATGTASAKVLSLTPQDTLKLTFHVLGSTSSEQDPKGLNPHQVHLLATGIETQLHWTAVIKLRGAGKAKWELDLARAPTDFLSLSTNGQILLEIVIADSSSGHKPLRRKLATVQLASSMILPYPYWDTKDGLPPSSLELEKYAPQPPIHWTFRPPRKALNPVFSLLFTAIALSPWLILISTWGRLSSSSTAGFKIISSSTSSTTIFLATIASQELLILTYWTSLRLYQYLPLAFLLTLPLILSGRTALSELRVRRKRNPISACHVNVSKFHMGDSKGKGKAE